VVDESLLGRVFGMQAASDGAAFAASFAFTAAILSVVSPRPLLAAAGALSALVALVAWRLLKRHQDELPEIEEPQGPPMAPSEPLVLSGPDLGR
jgi:hypothetical protein